MLIAIAARFFPEPGELSLAGVDPRDPEQVAIWQAAHNRAASYLLHELVAWAMAG